MQERGTDSSGFGVVVGNEYALYKKAKCASDIVDSKDYQKMLSFNSTIALAHTRFATVGAITDENAHPFIVGNILGIHNGSVSNYQEVANHVQVDSEAIFHLLNEYNNDFKKALKELRGQFAIAWVNMQKPSSLYLARGSNPLYIAKVNALDTYFFASTYYSLESIIGMQYKTSDFAIWKPKEDHVYEITGNMQITKTEIEFKSTYTYNPSYSNHTATCICSMCDFKRDNEDKKTMHESKQKKHKTKTICALPSGKKKTENACDTSECDSWEFIDTLTLKQVMDIWSAISKEACGLCNVYPDIDAEGAFYYNTIEKQLYCYECGKCFDKEKGVEFIDTEVFYDRLEEFDNEAYQEYALRGVEDEENSEDVFRQNG